MPLIPGLRVPCPSPMFQPHYPSDAGLCKGCAGLGYTLVSEAEAVLVLLEWVLEHGGTIRLESLGEGLGGWVTVRLAPTKLDYGHIFVAKHKREGLEAPLDALFAAVAQARGLEVKA